MLLSAEIFCYILIIIGIGNVHALCNGTLDSFNCAYNVYCYDIDFYTSMINIIDLNNFDDFQYNPPYAHADYSIYGNDNADSDDDNDRMSMSSRRSCNIIEYNNHYSGARFHPVHVTFRKMVASKLEYAPTYATNDLITLLNLCDNNYEFIPPISEMDNLIQLNVSKNLLTVAELSNTVDLPKLTEIDLSHNRINDIKYESGHIYRKLEKIDLSNNYLTKIPDAVFDPFNDLKTLDISHNYIEMLNVMTFEGMQQLKYLKMSFNRISDINSSLFRFNNLISLDISNNNIKIIKATDFNKLVNIKKLYLNSNFISAIDKNSFYDMPLLRSLYLNNNKLSNVDTNIFINVSYVESVDLSKNSIKKIPVGLFKGKHVSSFSINENHLEGSLEKGMFEGVAVDKLDLSNQYLDSVNDYTFSGSSRLVELLLNNNNISVLTENSFKTLQHLNKLDLSFNKIQSIEFKKDDLHNLLFLSLRKNNLISVKQENFQGLHSLQFLDLSDNNITRFESNSFVSLKQLINLLISNNPLSGTLEESTFVGLNSLPSLDISCTLLSSVHNGSFIGMAQLKNLNASHNKINALEYNIFIQTGGIETLDLSFNELKNFNVNSTELTSLITLYLNNNFIKMLNPITFKNIISLFTLSLSNNIIQNITSDVFANQIYLRSLDISFNSNFNLTLSLLNATKTLDTLNLSGIKTNISFGNVDDMSLTHLVITNSCTTDVKKMQCNKLRHLDDMNLSYNNIFKIEVGSFDNISTLRFLDLSYNKIKDIQAGVFKDNTRLVSLNVSHNYLTAISYGIFQGLIYLSTLDISYNEINDLQNERFYEVKSLSVLIADHNKIKSITADEFLGTSLIKLSIGGNPMPCEVLVNLKRNGVSFDITAIKLYENNDENVNGVTCNRKLNIFDRITNVSSPDATNNVNVLLSIRDIILDHFKTGQNIKSTTSIDEKYLANTIDRIQTSNTEIGKKITDFSADAIAKNNETNVLLNKILRVLSLSSVTRTPPVQETKDNATYENLLLYINTIKQELKESIKIEKDSILNEMETKISPVNSHYHQNNIMLSTETPKLEKLSVSDDSKSLFTETCVALILVILVAFVLFKVYKSGVFVRQRFSVSTRELPGSMDSPL